MNKVDIVKITQNGEMLPVIESFYSLQGEGAQTGKAAYFIRIGGCDIGCRWCDSKISWNPNFHDLMPIDTIVEAVKQTPAKSVVITGGEPLSYNLNPLCDKLKEQRIKTYLETSGAHPYTGTWDWICLSPKPQSTTNPELFKKADELKVIIYNLEKDLKHAENYAAQVHSDCKLYLQPEWSRYKINIEKIVEYIKQNPKWQISLQAHKFMNIP